MLLKPFEYAAELKAADVPVGPVEFTGMIRGLFGLVDATDRAYREINRSIQGGV
ncbi:MAG: hypothetical protein ACI8P9_001885 [Parasphingorhabdus sp.]|jgi:hypothetical protein